MSGLTSKELEELIDVLRRLIARPKHASLFHLLSLLLYDRYGTGFLTSCRMFWIMEKASGDPCVVHCPLAWNVSGTEDFTDSQPLYLHRHAPTFWLRCPFVSGGTAIAWREKQSPAEIIQRCVETIAVLEAWRDE